MTLLADRPPVCGIASNPELGIAPADMRAVDVGRSITSLAEEFCAAPAEGTILVCRFNGDWLSRMTPAEHEQLDALVAEGKTEEAEAFEADAVRASRGWALDVSSGDVVEFFEMPEGAGLRIIAGLVIAVASIYIGNTYGAGWGLAFAFGGNLLLAAFTPKPSVADAGAQGASVYSTSLQGNQAKLNAPIWKLCGRRKFFPPLAAMPYQQYVNASGTDVDNKQYYNALFAATIGNLTLESVQIGGTSITHFQDVLVSSIIAPGSQPSTVLANVETSTAVAGLDLATGVYVGGYIACKAQRTCTFIGIDIETPRGISQLISWRVEARAVNDFGTPIGAWAIVANESRNPAVTNTPQRWTYRYRLTGGPYRAEVRVVRTDLKNTSSDALHDVSWTGLRGFLEQTATLDATTTHYEVVLRGSSQMSQYSQRDFALIATGMCRTWSAGVWGAEVATRNGAWWALDCAVAPPSGVWGLGLPDARVDIQSFADLAATCDLRQDRFDYVFDQPIAAWDALQLIARACRARVFRRNGILTIARDDLQTLPVTAFTSRNTKPSSIQITEQLPIREQPDGIVIEYEDYRTWVWTPIDCPCPGVVSMSNPVRMQIAGVVGPTHAEREGRYEAAKLLYRTRAVAVQTELEATLPAYMAPVSIQPDIVGYGQTGDVVAWNPATLVMTLSEPPVFSATADTYLRLRRDDGSMTSQIKVTPGPNSTDITLPSSPDFLIVCDDPNRERPIFLLGPVATIEEIAKVSAITDAGTGQDGEQLLDLHAIIDDVRVHSADNALLPGPGDIQDPVTLTEDTDSGGLVTLIQLTAHTIEDGSSLGSSGTSASLTFNNDGTLSWSTGGSGSGTFAGEWNVVAISSAQAALAEIRFTIINPPGVVILPDEHYVHAFGTTLGAGSAATGAWLGLGTSRTIVIDNTITPVDPQIIGVQVLCEIRDAASQIVQASARMALAIWFANEDLGGGG